MRPRGRAIANITSLACWEDITERAGVVGLGRAWNPVPRYWVLSVLDVWRWTADAELLRAYAAELDAKLSLALDQVLFVCGSATAGSLFGARATALALVMSQPARLLLWVGDVGLVCGEGALGRRC